MDWIAENGPHASKDGAGARPKNQQIFVASSPFLTELSQNTAVSTHLKQPLWRLPNAGEMPLSQIICRKATYH